MDAWDPNDEPEAADPSADPVPWELPDYAADTPSPRRTRHDAFTPARRAKFLRRLAKYGCLKDAARKIGVSRRTVYNHRDRDERFDRDCEHALRMSGGGLERTAWQRGVEGVDQLFACGGQVYTRKRYSDGLLRMLLQGSNPKKYGPAPGFSRKRLHAWERKQLKKEVAAEFVATQRASEAQLAETLERRLDLLEQQEAPKRLAAGWTKDGEYWIPPGWVRAADAPPGEAASEAHEPPRDSV